MLGLVVMFFRFVTSGELRRRADFFAPFIQGMSNMSVLQVYRWNFMYPTCILYVLDLEPFNNM